MSSFVIQVASISGALAVAAAAAQAQPLQALGEPEGVVDIVAWPGYIERGATDPAYDWVTGFERQSGCEVRVKTANTSDEMVALMNEGGFDLVTASGDASLRLVAGKRVQEINTALIPSWSTVDARLQNAPWHTVDGRHYGVPYQWGSNVLITTPRCSSGRPRAGTWCSRKAPCPMASPTRAACRHSTARSTSRMPRST
jgi:putative spermidine/putrescine transport system substrate-binding protein